MAKILDGRAPKSACEVAATPRLLVLCQKIIGDSIDLSVVGPVSIVGIVEFPESLNKYAVFYAYVPDVQWGRTEWLVDLPPPVSEPTRRINGKGERDPLTNSSRCGVRTRHCFSWRLVGRFC